MYSLRCSMSLQFRNGKQRLRISLSKAVLKDCGWEAGQRLELSWGEGRWRLVEGEGNKLRTSGTTGAYWERVIFPQERDSLRKRYGVRGADWRLTWACGITYRRYTYQGISKSFLVVVGKPRVGRKRKRITNLGSLDQLRGK